MKNMYFFSCVSSFDPLLTQCISAYSGMKPGAGAQTWSLAKGSLQSDRKLRYVDGYGQRQVLSALREV